MIRNHAGGNAIRDTAQLIETLKKVGVIKGKKKRVKKALAGDEIRQDNEMVGYTTSESPQAAAMSVMRNVPLLLGQAQQSGFNQSQIEDIKRGVGQDLAVIRDALEEDKKSRDQQYGLLAYGTGALARQVKQLTEKARPEEPIIDEPMGELEGDIDIEERPFDRTGANLETTEMTDEPVEAIPEEIFAESPEEEENAPIPGAVAPPEPTTAPPKMKEQRKRFEQGAINVAMDEGGWRELPEISRMKTVELNDLLSKMEISGYKVRPEYKSKEYSTTEKRDIIWLLLEERGQKLLSQGQKPRKQIRGGK